MFTKTKIKEMKIVVIVVAESGNISMINKDIRESGLTTVSYTVDNNQTPPKIIETPLKIIETEFPTTRLTLIYNNN